LNGSVQAVELPLRNSLDIRRQASAVDAFVLATADDKMQDR
jgi:hypothetical protein